MLRYVESNQSKVDLILFLKWDRFSRNIEAAYNMIRRFKEMGVEVNSAEQSLDLSQPDSKVLLAVYLVIPEIENDKTSIRVTAGMNKANKEGCYTTTAPKGYLNARTSEGKATLTPDPLTSPIIQKIFRDYGTGLYSLEDVRRKYSKKLKISRNGLSCVLKNPTYMGKILIRATKKEDEMLVEGLHPALIDPETFERVQLILKGKYTPQFRTMTEIDEALPLRGFLMCPECGKTLTGSGSKGRAGRNTYFYYHCTRYCNVRHKARDVNALFEELLSEMSIEEDQQSVYKSILAERFSEQYEDKQTSISSLHREQDNLYKRLEMAEDSFFEQKIDAPTFNSMKARIDGRLAEIKMELKEIQHKERYFEKHLNEGIGFLKGIDTTYREASTEIKRKIIKTLFCEKLVYHGRYFSTPNLEESIEMILFRNRRLRLLRVVSDSEVLQPVG